MSGIKDGQVSSSRMTLAQQSVPIEGINKEIIQTIFFLQTHENVIPWFFAAPFLIPMD